jgi:hypothetical protein
MPICADCKAAPGRICFHHLVESSFDAPTEEEKRIAELEARCSRLERENLDLRPIVEQERDRANRAEAKAEEQGRTAVSLFDELKRAQAVIAKLDGRIAEIETLPVLVDGPHGRPEDDALVRFLREHKSGKVRTKEADPARRGLGSELAARHGRRAWPTRRCGSRRSRASCSALKNRPRWLSSSLTSTRRRSPR